MSDRSSIEWTDATWNPVTGCTEVSPGCDQCHARTLAERFRGTPGHYYQHGFDVLLRPDKLDQPLRWRGPRRIFVNSMSDLFHAAVPDDYIAQVFAIMASAQQHTFQVLTKRHARMRSLLSSAEFLEDVACYFLDLLRTGPATPRLHPAEPGAWPLPNVWLGVSVETQQWADIRIPHLLNTPAAVRFLSCEPLLGPVDLRGTAANSRSNRHDWLHRHGPTCGCYGCINVQHASADGKITATHHPWWGQSHPIAWVIVGGESGRHARPMRTEWVRDLRDQCQTAGVAFHFKQAGSVLAREWSAKGKGGDPADWPEPFPRQFPEVARPSETPARATW